MAAKISRNQANVLKAYYYAHAYHSEPVRTWKSCIDHKWLIYHRVDAFNGACEISESGIAALKRWEKENLR